MGCQLLSPVLALPRLLHLIIESILHLLLLLGHLRTFITHLSLQPLNLVDVLRLHLVEPELGGLALLELLPQLLLKLIDLRSLLLQDELALISLLGAATELVFRMTQLVLHLLLLTQHHLQLTLLVVPGRLLLVF